MGIQFWDGYNHTNIALLRNFVENTIIWYCSRYWLILTADLVFSHDVTLFHCQLCLFCFIHFLLLKLFVFLLLSALRWLTRLEVVTVLQLPDQLTHCTQVSCTSGSQSQSKSSAIMKQIELWRICPVTHHNVMTVGSVNFCRTSN